MIAKGLGLSGFISQQVRFVQCCHTFFEDGCFTFEKKANHTAAMTGKACFISQSIIVPLAVFITLYIKYSKVSTQRV